jgi:carboxyl-terminal processing protease
MSNKSRYAIFAIVAVLLIAISFNLGYVMGGGTLHDKSTAGLPVVDEAWNAIVQNYVEPSRINTDNMSHTAIKGMMEALNDPYSAFLDPQMYQLFQSSLEGSFQGIGAQVTLNKDKQPVILAPLDNSPAEKAGIKTGDIILAVDGKSTAGLSLTEVVLMRRGPAGTTVKLTVQHEGENNPVDIEIVRAQISSSTVSSEMKGDIGYIRIREFSTNTNDEFNAALQSILAQKATGIIIDVRDNPGGIVPVVVDVASHFIKDGVVLTLVDNKGNKTPVPVNPNGAFTDLPIVVLVNEYSASGSEVLTGALKDHNRATVAGVKTFGKGSYDINIPLKDGSDIYLTVGRWLRPNGQLIEGKGIEPDYVLTVTGDEEIQWVVDFLHGQKQ